MCSAPCSKPASVPCKELLGWYATVARDLPWRHTADPYRIWVSEIMLQQTQVATVLPRYAAWFDAFPDIAALADADIDDVLKAWEGLGYYRRARFMHAAAKAVVERHAGVFPADFDAITDLPGIGRSTAGAIASFCFGAVTPVLDGNVKRVLSRWHGSPDAADKALWAWAQQAIEVSGDAANWNQAMMELGATVCQPRPDCAACPVSTHCAAAFRVQAGTGRKKVAKVRDVHWRVHLHVDSKRGIWLARRPAAGIWAGLWTPPISELDAAPGATPDHVHLLTHRRLHLYAEHASDAPGGEGQWITDLDTVALPTGIHRLLVARGVTPR